MILILEKENYLQWSFTFHIYDYVEVFIWVGAPQCEIFSIGWPWNYHLTPHLRLSMFGSAITKFNFEWIDFVKLILTKNEFMWNDLCSKYKYVKESWIVWILKSILE